MATKSRGTPFPVGTDANDAVGWLDQLAIWVNDRPGVSALTTTQRNALAGAELWDGRIVLNTTTDRLNRYDLGTTTWVAIADFSEIVGLLATTGTPAAPTLAGSRGVSTSAARADHAHPTTQVAYTTIAMAAGWGGTVRYARASGIVTVITAATKANWGANESIITGTLPAGLTPPVPVFQPGLNSAVDNAARDWIINIGGGVLTGSAGTGSIHGVATYVAAT